ncbi:MAG: chorismate-binding protein [Bacteroidales bacterium]|nr:chorismate-binding protein [Bacteroidales bacterium]
MRASITRNVSSTNTIGQNLISVAKGFSHASVLLSNNIKAANPTTISYNKYEVVAGFGSVAILEANCNCLQQLEEFTANNANDWLFGLISYELKNEVEALSSKSSNSLQFPTLLFFIPEIVITVDDKELTAHYFANINTHAAINALLDDICKQPQPVPPLNFANSFNARVSKKQYIDNFSKIQTHIQQGDIYEMNYCIEFFTNPKGFDPYNTHKQLLATSPTPYSAFFKDNSRFLLCASPERYIAKCHNTLISQPIKGTIARGATPEQDAANQLALSQNPKERAENIMIVDLVRNDLSRIASKGTVNVDELCGIYPFRQVHQMISTVSCTLEPDTCFSSLLRATFPMGSMTGAPKVRAMQIIDEYEAAQRGLYSGTTGYISPNGDFDFNVVIRSLLYNEKKKYLSFSVGSAITARANAAQEYDECLLKASAILKTLNTTISHAE